MKKTQMKSLLFWAIIGLLFLVVMLLIYAKARNEGNSLIDLIKNSLW
ncbi:MAG: hypothetical protein QW524_03050 [Candidatus Woesearchaeota archaeon]